MKYVERAILTVFGLIGLFAVHQLVDQFMKIHNWKGLDAGAWAAWVQGIGSILAVIGAIWVMDQQAKRAQELADDTELRNVRKKFALIGSFAYEASAIARSIRDVSRLTDFNSVNAFAENVGDRLKICKRCLEQVQSHSSELPETAINIQRIMFYLEKLELFLADYRLSVNKNFSDLTPLLNQFELIYSQIYSARISIETAIEEFQNPQRDK